MLSALQSVIPILTSEAGACLTAANWQEVGVTTAAYYLDSLLLKPGFALLKETTSLSHYIGWNGPIVLNATKLIANKEGIITITSPYDGSKIKLTCQELIEIIQYLKPDAVILPKKIIQNYPQIWTDWNPFITAFLDINDLPEHDLSQPHGVYFNLDNTKLNLEQLRDLSHRPRYVMGKNSFEQTQQLRAIGIEWIETDDPANSAVYGMVYNKEGVLNLAEEQFALQFKVIDSECACPTCSQQFTTAYLHHLYLHTPLLCHRLLIQHNIYYWKENKLKLI